MIVVKNSTNLRIEKMPRGGFVVYDGYNREGYFAGPLFACIEIDEALSFIKNEMGRNDPSL